MKVAGYVLMFCLLFQSRAFAQPHDVSEQAKVQASQHFRRGVELFQEEAFRAAMAEFQRAYDIAPDYRLLYNLGQTKLELHDYLGAAQSYERYLAAGYLDITPERRAEVEQALAALRERTASVKIAVNRSGRRGVHRRRQGRRFAHRGRRAGERGWPPRDGAHLVRVD